ncbi:methylamine utilization protein MauJ [Bradyrhizobium sp. SZCCHNR1015]|uniref:methylamine utilization protein MauJ n=1 Tax=Bradyrhizobium sp. SZCCHNR1015 TaxID=3057338 RepID=UPI002916558E|nr:methylamine utilization protein MauJ [Bradyrhizobium sp. SZCCHNR1015]
MTKFLANWEVEADIILEPETPFLRYSHPTGRFTAFIRNVPEQRNDSTFLSMQFIFDAPSLLEAKEVGEPLAKEFLDHLALSSNLKVRLRRLFQIFNWEPSLQMRECLIYSPAYANDDAPYEAFDRSLLETVSLLQTIEPSPRVKRAMKWFSNGIAAKAPDDQFAFFWFAIELVAQVVKEASPVPDRCPNCGGPLHCSACDATPLHRPYPKQAIEQLFKKYVNGDPATLYQRASRARNSLMHGEDVATIETNLQIDFPELVDALGHLAWVAIINQFAPVLIGNTPRFLSTSRYVHMNMSGVAHMQLGFWPDFDNPDPGHFPKIEFSMVRYPPSSGPEEPPSTPG